jgi:hypothetical protein
MHQKLGKSNAVSVLATLAPTGVGFSSAGTGLEKFTALGFLDKRQASRMRLLAESTGVARPGHF